MGKDAPTQTTTTTANPIPGWEQALYPGMYGYLQQYLYPGQTNYDQSRVAGMSPYEQGGLNMYAGALGSLFGMSPLGAGQGNLAPYSVPQSPTSPYLEGIASGTQPTGGGGSTSGGGGWNQIGDGWGGWYWGGGGGGGGSGSEKQGLMAAAAPAIVGIPENSPAAYADPNLRVEPPMSAVLGGGGGGDALGAPGGLFGAAQGALGNILDPRFLDVANDPYLQAALERSLGQTRNQFAQAGLQYGTPLADAEMRSASDLFLNELRNRQALQSSVGQFGTAFPIQALQGYQNWASMPRELEQQNLDAAYQEFLRQQAQGRSDLMNAWQTGAGMTGVGQTQTGTSTPGGSMLGTLGQLASIYSGIYAPVPK